MENSSKYQTLFILLAVVLGLLAGHNMWVALYAGKLIVPLLLLMLFGLFLSIDVGQLRASFLNVRFSIANIAINFLWTPIFAYLLGQVFLSHQLPIWIGFVMLLVTPCTDWYLVFTGIARGNVPLSASVLPVNLVLQVLLLPVYLLVFFGESGNVELAPLVGSIAWVLFVPFILAWVVKKYAGHRQQAGVRFFERAQTGFLALAVMAMFASEGRNLTDNPSVISSLLLPVLVFFAVAFFLSQGVGRLLGFNYADKASLTLTAMARNSPIALAIAVAAFPGQPLIALSLVIGPLIELPVLAIAAQALLKSKK